VLLIFLGTVFFKFDIIYSENAISKNKTAWDHYKRAEYNKAIYEFTISLRYNAKYVDSMIGAGKSYYRLEIYDRALDMFRSALKVESDSVEALNGIGLVYGETGNFSEAISYLNRAFKISGDKSETEYALAHVYYRMGKLIWTKRKIESIFKKNPFHYNSLLLMADVKSDEKRYDEALKFIIKAIESDGQHPEGHIKYGDVLFKKFLLESNSDYANEAMESYSRALSIHPDNFTANINAGLLLLSMAQMGHGPVDNVKTYKDSTAYFERAVKVSPTVKALYSLGLSCELSGEKDRALDVYLKAYSSYPSDSLLRGKLESFLVLNDYKTGNPSRVMLGNDEYENAGDMAKINLHDRVIYHLRKSLLLNPLNRDVREKLISYYSVLDYNRFYIDEIKNLLKLYPENSYQDRLNLEIIKRRGRLYHREGYSSTDVPRSVPDVFVLNFDSAGKVNQHFDSGAIVAQNLNFSLRQYGRMNSQDFEKSVQFNSTVKPGSDSMFDAMKRLVENTASGIKADYMIFGSIDERDNYIRVDYKLMDLKRGFIIYESSERSGGKNSLSEISVKLASAIYSHIPYKGKILKIDNGSVLINLGLIDGLQKDSRLILYRNIKSRENNEIFRHREILRVIEADTYVSRVVPMRDSLLGEIDSTFEVFPLKNRRAKMIED